MSMLHIKLMLGVQRDLDVLSSHFADMLIAPKFLIGVAFGSLMLGALFLFMVLWRRVGDNNGNYMFFTKKTKHKEQSACRRLDEERDCPDNIHKLFL